MGNIFKINYLRNILIASLALGVVLPISVILFIYPSFNRLLIKDKQDDAVSIARHLAHSVVADQTELSRESLTNEIWHDIKGPIDDFGLKKLKIFSKLGEIIFSTDPEDIGKINKKSYFNDVVAKGKIYTKVVKKNTESLENQIVSADVVETYVPVIKDNSFIGAFEIYYDITERNKGFDKLISSSSFVLIFLAATLQAMIIIVLIKTGNNILNRKQAEKSLSESEERYRTAIENSNDGVSILKGDRHSYVNQKFVDIFGYESAREIIGEPLSKNIHPDDLQRVTDFALRRQAGESVPSRYELKGIRADGEIVYIEVSVAMTTYKGEAVSLAYLRDITERKQAEEKLQAVNLELDITNQQLENTIERANQMAIEAEYAYIELNQIFNSTADGMCVIDKNFNILRINNTLSNILDIKNEAINKKCYEVLECGICQGTKCQLTKALQKDKCVEIEIEKKINDSTMMPCILSAKEFRNPEGDIVGIVVNVKDITDRKKAEEEKLSREKFQGVLETAGAVCHELNQPLQVISLSSGLLLMDLAEDNPLYANIKRINRQVDRMGDITGKLITITRYETKDYLKGKIVDIDKASMEVE